MLGTTLLSCLFFRTVNKSFSGSHLDKKFTPVCSPPPETFEYNPVISQRWLKVDCKIFLV